MLGTILFFEEPYANIVLITFTALIIIELLNVYSTVNVIKRVMILSSFTSIIIYYLTIAFYNVYFSTSYVDKIFMKNILLLCAAAWLPVFIANWI